MRFEDYTLSELVSSLEGELAKASNEIAHAQSDLYKVENRQRFILALIHYIKESYGGTK